MNIQGALDGLLAKWVNTGAVKYGKLNFTIKGDNVFVYSGEYLRGGFNIANVNSLEDKINSVLGNDCRGIPIKRN